MMCLDLYLSSLSTGQFHEIQPEIRQTAGKPSELISLDFYFQHFKKLSNAITVENDVLELTKMAKKYEWQNNLNAILKNNSYEALVITDLSKKIIWVNTGFSKMTGYPKNFAINKTPEFLQGKETSLQTKKRIREQLQLNLPFKEVVVNYKKDNSSYKCEVHIFPLFNKETTHFLALEKVAS